MGLDKAVVVVEYDPDWPNLFAREQRRICSALCTRDQFLEHIGSTAVPGLAAKPMVDLMLGVETYPPGPDLMSSLVDLGYECPGEAGIKGRLYCRYRSVHAFNLHVVQFGRKHWLCSLALREYLRIHPAGRERYAETKRLAVAEGASKHLAYSEAKSAVVADLVVKAMQWKHLD